MSRPQKQLDLRQIFRAPRILTLEQLCRRMRASRSTVIRRLHEHGCYCSYNLCGKFFTIDEVAPFDSRGLWTCNAARFSKHGNLQETVWHFVESSEQGMTQQELASLLGVRTHNALLELVQQEWTQRERLGATFVYFSYKASVRRTQVRQRKLLLNEGQKPRPNSQQILAALQELIQDPQAPRENLVIRCQRSGTSISRPLMDAIFETYDLEKKRGLWRSTKSYVNNRSKRPRSIPPGTCSCRGSPSPGRNKVVEIAANPFAFDGRVVEPFPPSVTAS